VTTASDTAVVSKVAGVPERAYRTLEEIDAGRWPDSANAPGTKGGERFGNREGRLPDSDSAGRPLTYREWDVNPKRSGRSRDAERIVTGSDGSVWYTGDHYETFTRMR
jgi:guanyl-specific ribonuclease Sa